jgi:hypothetical protein
MLCKATGIFMIFFRIFIGYFEGLKLKQFLKQLKGKKKTKRRTELGRNRPAGHRSRARAYVREAVEPSRTSSSVPAPFLFFAFCFFVFFFLTGGPQVSSPTSWKSLSRVRVSEIRSGSTKFARIRCGFATHKNCL